MGFPGWLLDKQPPPPASSVLENSSSSSTPDFTPSAVYLIDSVVSLYLTLSLSCPQLTDEPSDTAVPPVRDRHVPLDLNPPALKIKLSKLHLQAVAATPS